MRAAGRGAPTRPAAQLSTGTPPARSVAARRAHRAALAVAERLGTEAVIFPSHHGGFLGGEFGYAGEPDAFAVKLREVLTAR